MTPPPPRYPHDGASIHYIVTGGGGGPLNSGGWREESSWAFTQNRICAYHVVEVQVEGRQLTVRAQRVSGTAEQPVSTLFEQFTVGP